MRSEPGPQGGGVELVESLRGGRFLDDGDSALRKRSVSASQSGVGGVSQAWVSFKMSCLSLRSDPGPSLTSLPASHPTSCMYPTV